MADQIVITEKSSQANDVRAAVGSRYGAIHLLDLLEPEDVVPAWKRWSPILLRPEGLYGTAEVAGGQFQMRHAPQDRSWPGRPCTGSTSLPAQRLLTAASAAPDELGRSRGLPPTTRPPGRTRR
jgi:hypothetical protein